MAPTRVPGSLCLIALFLSCQSSARDADAAPEVEIDRHPSAFLADVESRVVTSEISGRDYQISVSLPLGYADSTKSYPVLYAVDANGQFGTVVETARILRIGGPQIPQLLIVGIGYPYGGRQINAEPHRIVDFFPTLDREWVEEMLPTWPDPKPSYDAGGAADFLRFIREELFPLVEAEYRADPSDRALYGHSGGGFFGLYALLEGEAAFQRVIIGSPSLWWDDRYIFRLEESYAQANRALPARVFLSVGLQECDEQCEEANAYRYQVIANFQRLVQVLERRAYEGLEWQHQYFEDENHQSVVPATISRGLRFIYRAPG